MLIFIKAHYKIITTSLIILIKIVFLQIQLIKIYITNYMQRIVWIDFCRGLFMMMILWFHTDYYYMGLYTIPYSMYVENSLIGFFFISGYLFFPYKKEMDIKKSIVRIIRKLVIPYLSIVPIIFIIKKSLQNEFVLDDMFCSLLSGKASWFVASLILCHIYITFVCSIKSSFITTAACSFPFLVLVTCSYLNVFNYIQLNIDTTSIVNVSAIILFFMLCGHIYRKYEKYIDNIPKVTYIFIAAILIILKYIENNHDIKMTLYIIIIDNYPLFTLDTLLWCILVIGCCKLLHRVLLTTPCRYIEWIGSHSLIFYFICGGVPKITSIIMHRITETYYCMMPITFITVLLFSTIITWLLYKCSPFRKYILGVDYY